MPKIIDRDARRRDVIDAVWRIVVRDGVGEASLRNVAAETGLAIGSIRHYFGSHEELLVAAAQEMVDTLGRRLAAHAERVAAAPDRLTVTEELLGELLPLDRKRQDEVTVWFAFVAAARTNAAFAEAAMTIHKGTRSLMRRILANTRHAGDEIEVERLAALIDGLAIDATLQPALLKPKMISDVLHRHLVHLQES